MAMHTTGVPAAHAPLWQVSVCVQPSPSLHAAPSALFGCLFTPPAHVSSVQAMPSSTGVSLSFGLAAILPLPSQTCERQSFGVCAATGVPCAVKVTPHTPAVHVRVLHSSSVPVQSPATLHPTHWPMSLHTSGS